MSDCGYILFVADFDENQSKVLKLKNLQDLYDYFDDDLFVNNLVDKKCSYGEWHNYHLVQVN